MPLHGAYKPQGISQPYLFNHAMRSWLFAEAIGRSKRIDYDREVVAVGTILHDIGLTTTVSGPNRFEVNGANAALSFIEGNGLSSHRRQLIWDLIALNSTPSLALHKEPEVAVGTMGIGLDYGGFGLEVLPTRDADRLHALFAQVPETTRVLQVLDHVRATSARLPQKKREHSRQPHGLQECLRR